MIFWFTGQPGSGKTTLSKALSKLIKKETFIIDGDLLRKEALNFDYSEQGRKKNMALAIKKAKAMEALGYIVLVALVSPYKAIREHLKSTNTIVEIAVFTSIDRGKEDYAVKNYEVPTTNFIAVDTTNISVETAIREIVNHSLFPNKIL